MLKFAAIAAGLVLSGQAAAFDHHDMTAESPRATGMVQTEAGKVQGLMEDGIAAFKGIPYGKAPVGDLRFMPPQKPEAWEGVYTATSFGAPAMQMYSPSGPNHTDFSTEMQAIFPTLEELKIDNEDSLFLNVWTPATDDKKRPVMVWFHGGGYAYGSGSWPAYDGRNLAEKGDVVVVTVNHRLNLFGYLSLAHRFGDDFAKSGNAGNLDLVASLEWVRDNIAGFGGDPANVTIMGESGGGSKVSHLLAMPAADGLFQKAIIQSGPGVTSGKAEDAAALADKLLAEVGAETAEDLRAVPADTLLAAGRKVLGNGGPGGPNFGPVVDGAVLPRDPFMPAAPEQSADVPILIGFNKDEMTIFMAQQPWFGTLTNEMLDGMSGMFGDNGKALVALYREQLPDYSPTHIAVRAMGARFAYGTYILADQKARQAASGGAPVYAYWLTYETPVNEGILRTPHTLDIPFMFDNVDKTRVLVGPGDGPEKLADMMSDAWISFAKTGTPASELLPEWKPYTFEQRNFMQLDTDPKLVEDPEGPMRALLASTDRK